MTQKLLEPWMAESQRGNAVLALIGASPADIILPLTLTHLPCLE